MTQLAGIKVSDLQNPLTVLLVVDHAVSVVARSHLVWRMNRCLHVLIRNQVAARRAETKAMYPVLFLPGGAHEEDWGNEEEKQRRVSLRITEARQQRNLLDVPRTLSSSSIVQTAPRRKP
ncbi:hypothetical protein MRX96_035365 [Rhipicephalus microplus]